MHELPHITVAIPTYNEEPFLGDCLESLLTGDYPHDRLQVIVADGRSTDRTRELVQQLQTRWPLIELMDNPDRHQAGAINRAFSAAKPESSLLIRIDAHATYAPHFLIQCFRSATRSGADLIVFRNVPLARTPFQEMLVACLASPLAVGGARYRKASSCGPVDHGQHGCFLRSAFEQIGGYDPSMVPNEDGELSYRLLASGRSIFLDPDLEMRYYPRNTFRSLARQYFRWGCARCRNLIHHRAVPKPRQVLPPLLIGAEFCGLALSLSSGSLLPLLPTGLYASVLLGTVPKASVRLGWSRGLLVPITLALMHHSWGAGFWLNFLCLGRLRATHF